MKSLGNKYNKSNKNNKSSVYFYSHWLYRPSFLLYTGRNLNGYKTFRRCPGRLLNVSCNFKLSPVSREFLPSLSKLLNISAYPDFHLYSS